MKTIQLVTYNENEYYNYNENIEVSNFNNLKALDNYKINVFDLTSPSMWKNKSDTDRKITETTILTSDFRSINTMIQNSKKTKIVICLPQNSNYQCKCYTESYWHQLKDMIPTLVKILEQLIPFLGFSIIYENNTTQIGNKLIESSFYFNDKPFENITFSKDSGKVTSIKYEKIYLTTLHLVKKDDSQILLDFLKQIGIIEDKIIFPEWLYEYEFNDDQKQRDDIIQAKKIIEEQKEIIKKANEKLKENLHYKSILVNNSDDLVNVVFEIIEYIFDISLKDFNDEKKEDFLFKKNNITYIGEIKGVTSNVKYENISQLEVHYSKYLDKLEEIRTKETIKKILIMNYQRNKNVLERDEINSMQINLAIKNQTMIIDTKTLLTIYEKILQGKWNKEFIINYISNNSGIINLNEFNMEDNK